MRKVINGWSHYASELSNLKWKAEILLEVGERTLLRFLFKNLPPVVIERVNAPSYEACVRYEGLSNRRNI